MLYKTELPRTAIRKVQPLAPPDCATIPTFHMSTISADLFIPDGHTTFHYYLNTSNSFDQFILKTGSRKDD